MKKVIAIQFAVLYFVFTTFTFWQVNDEDGHFVHLAQDANVSIIALANGEPEYAISKDALNNIVVDKPISKVSKHLSGSGKRNLPKFSSVVLAFRNFFSFSTTGSHKSGITATPLLYYASIYLKNGVLRI